MSLLRQMHDISLDIARGRIVGSEPFGAYGEFTALGGEVNHIIWPDGAWALPPSIGTQMSIISTSINDAALGTGIRTVDLHYLDANLIPKTEVITLNGTTAVLTVATNIRFVQCMHLLTCGSLKEAGGTISAYVGTQNYSQIAKGANRCSSSARMVPSGKRCIVMGVTGSSVSSGAAAGSLLRIVSTYFYPHDYSAVGVLIPYGSDGIQDGSVPFIFPVPLVFPEGSVIAMTVTVDKAAVISGSWYGWIEDV